MLIIVIAVIKTKLEKKGGTTPVAGTTPVGGSASSSTNATNHSMTADEISEQMKKLKQIDEKFDEQRFKTHIKKVFMAVQDGWTKRDQKVCRPFMAEEVYQSHQVQIDSMIKNKEINVLENIVVGSVDFARIDLGTEFHKITMKLRASMRDYRVREDKLDELIGGNKTQSPTFTEYWTFIRRSNMKTKVDNGIFDRKCPNCGAPIEVDVAGICKYCDANVINGDYDWVLSEIIQKSEWAE